MTVRNGRPDKVGVDHHSGLCKGSCVCGKEAREQQEVEYELEQLAHDDGMAWDRHTERPENWS